MPIHSGKDLKSKTLLGIIKDMGFEKEQFKELLEEELQAGNMKSGNHPYPLI